MKMTGSNAVDNYGRPRSLYIDRLAGMTDVELLAEVERMVWLSAYAANNPRSDYHWQCDATHDEAEWRGAPEIYHEGWRRACRSEGHHELAERG